MRTKTTPARRVLNYWLVTAFISVLDVALTSPALASSSMGTAFTYQGELIREGSPANGTFDFVFQFYDGADPITSVLMGEASANGVAVSRGLFSVLLDPGANLFTGQAIWAQVQVKASGPGPYTALLPTQQLTPTPYAQYCAAAGTANALSGNGSFSGNLSVVGTFSAAGNTFRVFQGNAFVDAPVGVPPRLSLRPFESRANNEDLWEIAVDVSNPEVDEGRPLVFANGAAGSTAMLVSPAGNVGIGGYFNPESRLDVRGGGVLVEAGGGNRAEVALRDNSGQSWRLYAREDVDHTIVLEADGAPRPALAALMDGTVGIGTYTPDTSVALDVQGGAVRITSSSGAGSDARLSLQSSQSSSNYWNLGIDESGSSLFYLRYGDANTNVLSVAPSGATTMGDITAKDATFSGTATVEVLKITGADVAEKFPASTWAEPGTVMAIDPDKPGSLTIARGAYNRRVAGVVAGANDLKTGVLLGNSENDGTAPGGAVSLPVALSGRVWVRAEASNGPIKPGDFLTTSNLPGLAMKVERDDVATGAIIGKAMTGLTDQRGMVLTLINLQ